MWLEYLSIIALVAVIIYTSYKFYLLNRSYLELKRELNNQTLDYHLKKVHELGYDFTIKASSHMKKPSSGTAKKPNKSKHLSELIE